MRNSEIHRLQRQIRTMTSNLRTAPRDSQKRSLIKQEISRTAKLLQKTQDHFFEET